MFVKETKYLFKLWAEKYFPHKNFVISELYRKLLFGKGKPPWWIKFKTIENETFDSGDSLGQTSEEEFKILKFETFFSTHPPPHKGHCPKFSDFSVTPPLSYFFFCFAMLLVPWYLIIICVGGLAVR